MPIAAAREIKPRSQPKALCQGVSRTPGAERRPPAVNNDTKVTAITTKA